MSQIYPCTNCKKDSVNGGSIVYGGMFFKMCPECLEDEEVIRTLNNFWRAIEEESEKKQALDELVKQAQDLNMGY